MNVISRLKKLEGKIEEINERNKNEKWHTIFISVRNKKRIFKYGEKIYKSYKEAIAKNNLSGENVIRLTAINEAGDLKILKGTKN